MRVAAATLQRALRKTDIACRLGGDEFAVLLLETDANSANLVIANVVASTGSDFERGLGRQLQRWCRRLSDRASER